MCSYSLPQIQGKMGWAHITLTPLPLQASFPLCILNTWIITPEIFLSRWAFYWIIDSEIFSNKATTLCLGLSVSPFSSGQCHFSLLGEN